MPEKQESRENPRCEPRGDVDDLIFCSSTEPMQSDRLNRPPAGRFFTGNFPPRGSFFPLHTTRFRV